ncbi:MAG: ABC transporter substrate-binding protein [Streptosporangiaceae bacterium]
MAVARKVHTRRGIAAGAIGALALVVAACGSSAGGGGGPSGSSNAVLKVGVLQQFVNPNPFNLLNIIDYDIAQLDYPALVQYSHSQIAPDLATSWTSSPDGKTWTFHLVPGAKWSDGKPLTSADVLFTFRTDIKYASSAAAIDSPNVAGISSVSAPNPTTFVINFSTPRPEGVVLGWANITPILPEHIWAKYATGNGAALKTFPNKPPGFVGGGPYIPVQWNGTNFLLMKRNPYYYGPKPGAAEVGIQYFTTPDGILQALKTKQIDYANSLPQSTTALLRKSGLAVDPYPSVNYISLFFNMKNPLHKVLQNPVVRQAMNLAMDRSQMISVAYPGSTPGASVVPPADGSWWDSSVTSTYNVSKANALLAHAGYKRGSNGIRIADGQPMSYSVIFDSGLSGAGDRLFQILQRNLAAIGVSVTQDSMDSAAFNSKVFGTKDNYAGWDLALEQLAPSGDPSQALDIDACTYVGSFNFSGLCNKTYEAMNAQQLQATNVASRQAILYRMQAWLNTELPQLVLEYNVTVDAHLPTWTGFGPDPFGSLSPESKDSFTGIHD